MREWTFGFTGDVQTFVVPESGVYRFEVWGAQGGFHFNYLKGGGALINGGYGGYSIGYYRANKNKKLFIYVGGKGSNQSNSKNLGGWNGGGCNQRLCGNYYMPTGGGGTDICVVSSSMNLDSFGRYSRTIESYRSRLIVAGGGGGACAFSYLLQGGHGGGINGTNGYTSNSFGYGGTQTSGGIANQCSRGGQGEFGKGNGGGCGYDGAGGGGGWYGGGEGYDYPGGGGSGFIGNVTNYLSKSKEMICYQCSASTNPNTRTTSTNTFSIEAKSFSPKSGNGFAKITMITSTQEINKSKFYKNLYFQLFNHFIIFNSFMQLCGGS